MPHENNQINVFHFTLWHADEPPRQFGRRKYARGHLQNSCPLAHAHVRTHGENLYINITDQVSEVSTPTHINPKEKNQVHGITISHI